MYVLQYLFITFITFITFAPIPCPFKMIESEQSENKPKG